MADKLNITDQINIQDTDNKDVKVTLKVDSALYSARFENSVKLFDEKGDEIKDDNTNIDSKPKFQLNIYLGKYLGSFNNDLLAFEKLKNAEKQIFIKNDDSLISIKEDLSADDSLKTVDELVKDAEQALIKAKSDNTIKPEANTKVGLAQSVLNILEQIRAVDSKAVLDLKGRLQTTNADLLKIQGGKPPARRGGASKRRLSKKEKKTRKAKRSGRKA